MKIKNLKKKIKDFTSSLDFFKVIWDEDVIVAKGTILEINTKRYLIEDLYMISVKGKKAIHLILKEV